VALECLKLPQSLLYDLAPWAWLLLLEMHLHVYLHFMPSSAHLCKFQKKQVHTKNDQLLCNCQL
jgi:hypothetical protein